MKIKIFLVPTLILVMFSLSVWVIYPTWTNGTDGVLETWNNLDAEKTKLESAQKRDSNFKSMSSELKNNDQDKQIIDTFISDEVKEDEIIDNLNFLIKNEDGMTVESLSVNRPKEKPAEQAVAVAPVTSPDGTVAPSAGSVAMPMIPISKDPTEFSVNFIVTGNYIQIKSILDKLYNLRRFNKIKSLNIASADLQKSEDNLRATMELTFNYYKSKKLLADNLGDPVFETQKLNFSVSKDILSQRSVSVIPMNVVVQGKENPFIP